MGTTLTNENHETDVATNRLFKRLADGLSGLNHRLETIDTAARAFRTQFSDVQLALSELESRSLSCSRERRKLSVEVQAASDRIDTLLQDTARNAEAAETGVAATTKRLGGLKTQAMRMVNERNLGGDTAMTAEQDGFVDVDYIAKRCDTTVRTVRRWINAGMLPKPAEHTCEERWQRKTVWAKDVIDRFIDNIAKSAPPACPPILTEPMAA